MTLSPADRDRLVSRVFGPAAAFGVIIAAVAGCSAPGGPGAAGSWDWRPDAGGDSSAPTVDGVTPITSAATCAPAQSSLALPARSTVMSAEPANRTTPVYTEQLF